MKFLLSVFGMLALSSVSLFAASPCPAVQADTNGCEFVITVTAANGSGVATAYTVTTSVPDQGPFDACDDTLVGIVNSSGVTLKSITLTGMVAGEGIFDFDGDGACTNISCTNAAGDTSGYGGPGVNFSAISGNQATGTVNVGCTGVGTCTGLANGASAWFSLEGTLTASVLGPTAPATTPVPSSVWLMLVGLGALGTYYFGNGKFARAN
jgi:hypothetical protein